MFAASVIIPTYNRPQQLQRVLECLAQQDFMLETVEVLVIDDGSDQSYQAVCERHWPFAMRCIRQENSGEVVARARGVRAAQSDLLVFLDDDIYVEPGYIKALVGEHQCYPGAVLIGVLYPLLEPTATPFERALAEFPRDLTPGDVSFLECGTGTMSVSRAVYEAAGGMQTLGAGGRNAWGGMDFAYRAHCAGAVIRRVPAAAALHDDYALKSLPTMSKRYFHIARMAVLHFRRYPQLLPQVAMFRDKTPVRWRSDPPRLIARKLARRVFNSRLALAVMRWMVRLLEHFAPESGVTAWLYRAIVRGCLLQGYRSGLRDYGEVPV